MREVRRRAARFKAIFPGASNTVILPKQLDTPLDFDSMRGAGSDLGAGGFAVFDDTACMVRAAYLYSRFLWVESCAQCPACKFGTGEVSKGLDEIELRGRAPGPRADPDASQELHRRPEVRAPDRRERSRQERAC
jgi:NADH:ubiquinone oxidoreductase subunit F (NADH-binding)